jgi:hypothetical protein
MLSSIGLQPRILAERSIPFRPFIDGAWLDKLGGEAEGLYSVREGIAYETLYVVDLFLALLCRPSPGQNGNLLRLSFLAF